MNRIRFHSEIVDTGVIIFMKSDTDFSLALTYHENSKQPSKSQVFNPNPIYKIYPNSKSLALDLTEMDLCDESTLFDVIYKRESVRRFSNEFISFKTLSSLLYASFGIKMKSTNQNAKRMYPSAGARYPVEIYVVVLRSVEIEGGVYHYNVHDNILEKIKGLDAAEQVMQFYNNQNFETDVPMFILFSAIFSRSMEKYSERGYRYALLDAGHMGQNLSLVATHLELGTVGLGQGAVSDEKFEMALALSSQQEHIIYGLAVGYPEI